MHFRVTSVSNKDVSALVREVTVRLEDALNNLLGDGNFGETIDQLVLVVVSVDDNEAENHRWLKGHNRLGSYKDLKTSQPKRYLSVGISMLPAKLTHIEEHKALRMISKAFSSQLEIRPSRLPRGLDFPRLSKAVRATLQIYAQAA